MKEVRGLSENISSRDSVQPEMPMVTLVPKPAKRWLQDLEEISLETVDKPPPVRLFQIQPAEEECPDSPGFRTTQLHQSSGQFPVTQLTLMSPQHKIFTEASSEKFTFGVRDATHSQCGDEDDSQISPITLQDPEHSYHQTRKSPVPRLRLELLQSNVSALKPVTYAEAVEGLLSLDLSRYHDQERGGGCWRGLIRCCGLNQEIRGDIRRKIQDIVALSRRKLGGLEIERRLLFSIWQACKLPLPFLPISGEWKHLGFKSADPRSESSLVLLQLLCVATQTPVFFSNLQETALKPEYQFSIVTATAVAVETAVNGLQRGVLSEVLRARENVFEVFTDYFLGCLSAWFADQNRWPGAVDRAALSKYCGRNPQAVLKLRENVH